MTAPARWVTPGQLAVRVTGAAAVVAAVLVAGGPPVVLALVAVSAVAAAMVPEPIGAPASLFFVLLAWLMGPRDAADWRTLLVALAVLVEHSCLTIAAAGPPTAHVPATLVRATAARAAVVAAGTVLAWLAVGVVTATRPPVPLVVVLGALAGVAAVTVAATRP